MKNSVRWTRRKVINDIKKTKKELSAKNIQKNKPRLYGAAIRIFGTWRKAIEAAGLNYQSIAKRRLPGSWSREVVVREIKMLSFRHSSYIRKKNAGLYNAALRLWGSWKNAVEAAGFCYEEIRKGWIIKKRKS